MTTEITPTKKIVFIDGSLANIDQLLAGLAPGVEVVILDPACDGVAQMAAALAGLSGLAAIHIVSHGSEGMLQLGSAVLDGASLVRYEAQLAIIGEALADTGDLMLYGCDVAAGASGQSFIAGLAALTGADVAASTDLTGAALLGGDWVLEAASGNIETSVPFATDALARWQGTLDTITGDNNANVLAGTVNADTISGLGGNDTLFGGGGDDTLDGGTGTDTADYGQPLAGYRFGTDSSGRVTVTDIDAGNGYHGTDSLIGVEQALFADGTVGIRHYAETRINTYVTNDQMYPSVAGLSGGGYVVTWSSYGQDGSGYGIYAQRYDASGNVLGSETQVNSYTPSDQIQPAIAALSGGGYVVTWMSQGQDDDGAGIYAQRYDPIGNALGPEIRINTYTTSSQDAPAIAALSGGGYVVTWWSNGQDGDLYGIYARRYDADGNALGPETQVNTYTASVQYAPAIAALSGGGYVVTWMSQGQDGSGLGIYAQRYAANGTALGPETRINTYTISDQEAPVIAALPSGGYVVTWGSNQDSSSFGVYAQRYDADGNALGSETRINTYASGEQRTPAVAALSEGGYVVTWHSIDQDGSGYGIYAQRFDTDGNALGSESRINAYVSDSQYFPAVAALSDGGYIIAWNSSGQDGSGHGIYAQRYDSEGRAVKLSGDSFANRLTWSGQDGIHMEGASGADTLTGANGDDLLDGGMDIDSMVGGAGDDFYVVDDPLDSISEGVGAGTDTVSSSTSHTLSANVENLVLTGASPVSGTGNADNNSITGNANNNSLSGADGDDTLIGGGGADSLAGGNGDDLFYIDSGDDTVTEGTGEGSDTVSSSASYTIADADVENLTLTGSAASATGNTSANTLTGNAQNNVLTGLGGNDTLDGGAGSDTAVYAGTLAGHGFGVDGSKRLTVADTDIGDGDEGTDSLSAIEVVSFSDQSVTLHQYVETRINTTAQGNQDSPALAALSDGGYVAVWNSDGQDGNGSGIYLQRYDAAGNVVVGETRINTTTNGAQYAPAVVALSGGGFVVAWAGAASGDTQGIYFQRYLVNSTAQGGETLVNTTTGGDQYGPTLAALPGDGFVVGWTSVGQDGSETGVYTQRFNGSGSPLGTETQVNTTTTDYQQYPSIAALSGGGHVVVWHSLNQDGSGYGVYAQRFASDGSPAGSETPVNTFTSGSQYLPEVAALAGGGYVVAWMDYGQDGSDSGVYFRRFADDGTALSGEIRANTTTALDQRFPDVAALADGGFVIAWVSNGQDGSGYGVYLQRYDASGTAFGGEVQVNDFTTNNQFQPTVTALADGGWVVAWTTEDLDGSGYAINSQRFDAGGNALGITGGFTADTLTWLSAGGTSFDGGDGNDTLAGGAGDDLLTGGTGTDTASYASAPAAVTVSLAVTGYQATGGAGSDRLIGFEHLIGSAYADQLAGNAGNNSIDGAEGNDTLVGSIGSDTLTGGAGSDTASYAGFSSAVTASLLSNLVNFSGGTHALSGIENLTGSGFNDSLTGSTGANVLDGGAGSDTLTGGAGDDTYVVDSAGDVVQEVGSGGIDLVQASVTYTLAAEVENLTLIGIAAIEGAGNNLANVLTGNSAANILDGGAGNDTLVGGAGNDTMAGGANNDTYVVDSGGDLIQETAGNGTDLVEASVTHALAAEVENLTLTGVSEIDGTGNTLDNNLAGNSADNILDGDAGKDTLTGGDGGDTYMVDNPLDQIVELADEGTDSVWVGFSYTLGAEIENLVLTGESAIDGTGNALANELWGNAAANILDGGDNLDRLYGFDGNDTLIGGLGPDQLYGGNGDDTYIVEDASDSVQEYAGDGTDLVEAGVSHSLAAQIENLTLTGGSAINGTGNNLANVLTGNSAANILDGGAGNDTLVGGAGNDTMAGGANNDTYVVDSVTDVVYEMAGNGRDLVEASVTHALAAEVENLTLTGGSAIDGSGNALANVLTGNSAANILDGGAGNDTLAGGAGNDTYVVDTLFDVVTELDGGGNDTIRTGLAIYSLAGIDFVENLVLTGTTALEGHGNALNNRLVGNVLANILDGGAGVDTLEGGKSDDIYYVDHSSDSLVEILGEGTDTANSTVSYVLPSNVEYLVLSGSANINGTGNFLSNILVGNAGDNTLNGGLNDDIMIGGPGNDVYKVDNPNDVIIENPGEGTDRVESTISFDLAANVENLTLENIDDITLLGTGDFSATGNELNNVLIGNTGHNLLDGRGGNDSMQGGQGNDSYIVEQAGDVVSELAGQGIDHIRSTLDYSLVDTDGAGGNGGNVENLTLEAGAINGTGNDLANVLTGNGANNSLVGGAGDDSLDGGAGADTMIGGTSDDDYYVDNAGDQIVEAANEGRDAAFVDFRDGAAWNNTFRFTLPDHVEDAFFNYVSLGQITEIVGNELANRLTGNAGSNKLDGGAGNDTLEGGQGDDTYVVGEAGDQVIEAGNEGTDTVEAAIDYSLADTDGDNVENLVLTGSAVSGTGNTLGNVIRGNATLSSLLRGGAGADTLKGGSGDDIVDGGADDDVIVGGDGAGNDRYIGGSGSDTVVYSSANTGIVVDLAAGTASGAEIGNDALSGIENVLGGQGDDILTGDTLDNRVEGDAGADTLNGGLGADFLLGGAGDDTYIVDNSGDVVFETDNTPSGSQGLRLGLGLGSTIDTVVASINYVLTNYVENLALATGSGARIAIGNSLDNSLVGNEANNTVAGEAGDDTLVGGGGNDILAGGGGNDTLSGGAGIDVFDYDSTADNGMDTISDLTPGDLIRVSGASFSGAATNGNGAGVGGNQVQVADSGGHTVLYVGTNATPGADIVITLGGTYLAGQFLLNGNSIGLRLINTPPIGDAADNTLNGGSGADLLIGGAGNDTYLVNNAGDVVTENDGEGTDLVKVSIAAAGGTYTLAANVENATLTNAVAFNLTGNELDNLLTGNAAANTLDGGSGNDTLNGGAGNDTYVVDVSGDTLIDSAGIDTVRAAIGYTLAANLEHLTLTGTDDIDGTGNTLANTLTGNDGVNVLTGLAGNDTYVVQNAGDGIIETSILTSEIDTVLSSVTWTLDDNLERLTLTGTAAIDGTGNALANILTGNAGNNTLDGGDGKDTLVGGLGDDSYLVDLTATGALQDVITEAANAGTDSVILRGSPTLVNAVTLTLAATLENLDASATVSTKLNLTGNTLANTLTGNDAANTLNGGTGIDSLIGGDGSDTYVLDNAADVVTELTNEGTDLVKVSIAAAGGTYTLAANVENGTLTNAVAFNLTGNELDNTLTGNAAANILDGGSGNDTLNGGAGNDTYVVDVGGDIIIDSAGIDTVQAAIDYTLAANLEHLALTGSDDIDGTGTALANTLTGNHGANVLTGLTGNDTYVVSTGDTIIETSILASEIDTVLSSVTWTLDANLERLTLTGTANIDGTGNALANILTGNAGNNTLDGGDGKDTLVGGLGDDTYLVDLTATGALQDVITEAANAGTDSVILRGSATLATPVTLTLAATLENLDASATGSTKLNLTGNTLANTLTGNDAANTLNGGTGNDILAGGDGSDLLIGGAGNDILTGGADADLFVFNVAASATNRDTVTDFISGTDVLRFDNAVFTTIGVDGALNAAAFVAGDITGGQDAGDRIVYNTTTGALYYDADGSGASVALQVAMLTDLPGLAATDIFVM